MAIKSLEEKFFHGLGDIYDAEHQFLEAQQEMLSQASSGTVQKMLTQHIAETEGQIDNLKQVYKVLGKKAKRIKCDGASGLVTEGQKLMKETAKNPSLLDCAIVGAGTKVEHYEIACYRGLIGEAEQMGHDEVIQLLRVNLSQEEQTAKKLEKAATMLLQQTSARAAGA